MKDYSISAARATAMMMIICCHILQFYGSELAWWLNSGVQVFLVISGFIYGQKEIENCYTFIKGRAKRILVPYYVYLVPSLILYGIIDSSKITFSRVIRVLFCLDTIEGLGHLWFVGIIVLCYLITPYLYWFCRTAVKDSKSITFIHIGIGFLILQIITCIYFSYVTTYRIACYIFGYLLGFLYKKYGSKIIKYTAYVAIPVSIVSNILRIILKYGNVVQIRGFSEVIFSVTEGYCHLLLGVTIFLIFKLMNPGEFTKFREILDITDSYSYSVYIVHHFLILGPISLLKFFKLPINIIVLLAAVVVSAIFEKIISDLFLNMINKNSEAL